MNFNDKHPELKKGEMFITNSEYYKYFKIGWKSKRIGIQSYDIYGKKLKNMQLYL